VSLLLTQETIDVAFFNECLQQFLTTVSKKGFAATERGGVVNCLHYQIVGQFKTKTEQNLKSILEKAMGISGLENRPPNVVVCVKQASGKGLHTFTGLLSYCLKDRNEEHFSTLQHNISEEDKDAAIKEYVLWGAVQAKRVKLNMQILLDKMEMHYSYCTTEPLASTNAVKLLTNMLHTTQYVPTFLFAGTYCRFHEQPS
jgi:hypothetical protein